MERYWKRYQERVEAYCKQRGGYRQSKLDPHRERLIDWLGKQPDLTFQVFRHKHSKTAGYCWKPARCADS